ncbi:MAG: hypothetical protein JNM17_14270 [Archangium sp.]|nr:hypothetical protein [Archangium sp.]
MDRELALLRRAANQDGLITRADALKLVTRQQLETRLRKKRWDQVRPRVYLVTGAPRTRSQALRAIFLWLRRGFAFSHSTAAALLKFRGYKNEGDVELTRTRRTRAARGLRIHFARRLPNEDLTEVGELPVTNVERTLVEVAAREKNLKALVDDLLSKKRTTLDKLLLALIRLNPSGSSPLWPLVDAYRGGEAPTESELERLVLEVLTKAGLPLPKKQKALYIAGKLRRLDFIYEEFSIVIEADGYITHSSTEAFESDRTRQNEMVVSGLIPLRWTWRALTQMPNTLTSQLRQLLISRGAVLPPVV